MNGKSQSSSLPWIDPDDAPELTDAFFEQATGRLGDQIVPPKTAIAALIRATSPGRPPSALKKRSVTVRYDADVLAAFRASGKGWQTRMNEALREWLKDHPLG